MPSARPHSPEALDPVADAGHAAGGRTSREGRGRGAGPGNPVQSASVACPVADDAGGAAASPRHDGPVTLTPSEAETRLEALIETIVPLLYEARYAHVLGVPRVIPFDSLPRAWQQDVRDEARMVVMRQSTTRRERAEAAARRELTRWLEVHALAAAKGVVGVLGESRELFLVTAALRRFINDITVGLGPSVVSEVQWALQQALCRRAHE